MDGKPLHRFNIAGGPSILAAHAHPEVIRPACIQALDKGDQRGRPLPPRAEPGGTGLIEAVPSGRALVNPGTEALHAVCGLMRPSLAARS